MSPSRSGASLALWCLASVAHAHAPLPRGLAVERDSGAVAIRMPGFGWLLSDPGSIGSEPGFAYACDALLGVSPLQEHAPMAYRADGVLLIGTEHGLHALTQAGCPAGEPRLSGLSVTAIAVDPGPGERIYVTTQAPDGVPVVQRSDDGGERWTLASQLPAQPVTALVLDAEDPQTLYVSQRTGMKLSSISVSRDGGASFETTALERELMLVHGQAEPARLWAVERVPNAPVGWSILRAEQPQGLWQAQLQVNFFGGFAVDPSDPSVIWVGDEARGVFRSEDGGDSFEETQPSIASACLAYGGDALWSCTPGLPERTALVRSPDALADFEPIMAFAEVDRLVDCGAEVDVAQVCAAAWIEWQRDVLGMPPVVADAGVSDDDAGAIAGTDASPAMEVDAAMDPAPATPAPKHSDCGCVAAGARASSSPTWLLALTGVALASRRRKRA